MANTYFNDAIIGNSGMLVCLTRNGELTRLFWPNIDYPQHFEKMATGIFYTGQKTALPGFMKTTGTTLSIMWKTPIF